MLLSGKLEDLFVQCRYSLNSGHFARNKHFLPSVVCSGCKSRLYSQNYKKPKSLPPPVNYSALVTAVQKAVADQISALEKAFREGKSLEVDCECPICKDARLNGQHGIFPLSPFISMAPAAPKRCPVIDFVEEIFKS